MPELMSWDMCSHNHFLDSLGHRNSISVCVLADTNWDAYTEEHPWGKAFVGHVPFHGQLIVHGVIIRGQRLKDLCNDLNTYQCRVNRDGFSFFYIATTVKHRRLNDLFPWYKYGVQPKFDTVWDRLEISNDRVTILSGGGANQKAELDALKNRVAELNQRIQAKDVVLKQKEEELTRKGQTIVAKDKVLKEKEEELIKKGEAILARDKIVKALEEELTKKDETIQGKDKVIKDKEEEIKKKDKTIQVLKNAIDAFTS